MVRADEWYNLETFLEMFQVDIDDLIQRVAMGELEVRDFSGQLWICGRDFCRMLERCEVASLDDMTSLKLHMELERGDESGAI